MVKVLFSLSIVLIFVSKSLSQEVTPSNWDISFSYGSSIPIGAFHKIVPEKSITYSSPNTYYVNGFDKNGNSAATVGQFASLNVTYHFNEHWFLNLEGYGSRNSVNIQPVLDYINQIFIIDYTSASNDDYSVSAILIGIGYRFNHKKFNFDFKSSLGSARMASPDYAFESYVPSIYEVQEPVSTSFAFGIGGSIAYRVLKKFYIGLNSEFNSANFDYEVKRVQPGSNPLSKTDRVTYRVLKVGLTIGARF